MVITKGKYVYELHQCTRLDLISAYRLENTTREQKQEITNELIRRTLSKANHNVLK